jgi:PAS domain S-box-containing protein
MLKKSGVSIKFLLTFLGVLVVLGLYASSRYNYLLFHSLVELFSVLVAFVIFILVWNTRRLLDNHYLLLIGIASLCSGALDLVHLLAYKGMGVFPGYDANLATQLWVAFRSVFSIAFFLASFFITRKLNPEKTLTVSIAVTALVLSSIFLRWFPDCFVEGAGLTSFKIVSEYVICVVFLAALVALIRRRHAFDRTVLKLMVLSLVSSVISELSFTQYVSVYSAANMAGHYFELLSYLLIYRAIVVTGVVEPSRLLFRNMKLSEKRLKESETRFKAIFENSVDAIGVSRDGVHVFVNPAYLSLYGYANNAELMGKSILDLIAPEEHGKILEYVRSRKKGKAAPSVYETRGLRKDGTEFDMDVHVSTYAQNGETYTLVVIRDITVRKQVEEALRKSHEELEKNVRERTADLTRINEELETEIVERIRTERKIDESQQNLLDTLESIKEGFFTLDSEWRFTYVNTEATRLWRRSREELIGKSLWNIAPAAKGSIFDEEYHRAVREKTPVSFEALSPLLDIWVEARAYPSRDGLSVYFHDITERKNAEESISRLNRLYSVLSKVSEAIVRIHDPKKLYERVCRIAVEDGLFKMAWIGMADPETRMVNPVASYGDAGGYLEKIKIYAADVSEGRGPTGSAAYEGTYSICGDIEHDPRMLPWRDKALRYGFRSSAAFPLRTSSGVIGAFTIYSSKPQHFTSEEIVLLNSLAENLSLAIDSMNNERMQREAEESLRKSSEEIRILYNNIKVTNDLLQLYTRKFSYKEYLDAAVGLIRAWSGCRYVGLRLADADGNIPYESCAGYDQQFLDSENELSLKHDQCVCVRVILGTPEPQDLPATTPAGSFYSDNAIKFVDGLAKERKARFRGVCMQSGFTSLAVVPIRYRDKILGAIHAADEREGMAPLKNVEFLEHLALIIGEALFRFGVEDELRGLNKNLEQRVFERTAELQAANKELEAFAYSVSHDLRAPLRFIDGFAHAIEEEQAHLLDDRGKDYFRRVRAATAKMSQLIDALLGLSRQTRGELKRTTVDLSSLAQAVTRELRKTPGRPAEFVIAEDVKADGDETMLHVVIENLLANAWKFTGKRESARIEFGAFACGMGSAECGIKSQIANAESEVGKTVYYVRDNGAGFDMNYANKLFTAFQRLHAEAEFPGIGIGLATVQRIIHRHGGRIWAEGEIGKGATFFFTLG